MCYKTGKNHMFNFQYLGCKIGIFHIYGTVGCIYIYTYIYKQRAFQNDIYLCNYEHFMWNLRWKVYNRHMIKDKIHKI